MARKPRIEFPGAIYHVISRGNYRKDLFVEHGSGRAFERALFEASAFSNWRLHAYTIMSNHYHAVIETPDANLSVGMHWLQGTFANRFNRLRGERGHVFQGRFKSYLVEPGESLRRVVDYVHLNPVRAGIVSLEKLRFYELSSYEKFWWNELPPGLVRLGFLSALGLPDNLEGMDAYENWLANRWEGNREKEDILRKQFHNRWIIGSDEFRSAVQQRFENIEVPHDWGGSELQDLVAGKWEKIVQDELSCRCLKESDLLDSPKLVAWKIEISRILRTPYDRVQPVDC